MKRMMTRQIVLALLPLVLGVGAGWAFISQQPSCGSMVGPLFAAKCGRRLIEYQLWLQTMGTVAGTVLAALVGILLEWRRNRRTARNAVPMTQIEAPPDQAACHSEGA